MIVRVLQSGDSESVGEVVSVPGVGPCQVCDDGLLTSSSQLTTWLSSARSAAEAATLLVWPRLKHGNFNYGATCATLFQSWWVSMGGLV